MAIALKKIPPVSHPDLLVGYEHSDDAAVFKLDDDKALIQTLDFFTPVVDDPYMFGKIAAANALSDIYAMGGKPLLALNIVCFPGCLDMEILGEILRGGNDKVMESGAILVGGHTVDDNEPKYGLSVTGIVHPQKTLTNSGAKPGDLLVLTKPLGTGIMTTAIKGELVTESQYDETVRTMEQLNKVGAESFINLKINAVTDITGFGLVGHLVEMAKGASVSFRIDTKNIPVIKGVQQYAEMGIIPTGTYNNKDFFGKEVKYINEEIKNSYLNDILFDPQTSGGLLVSLPKDEAAKYILSLEKNGSLAYHIIGSVSDKKTKYIELE